MKRANNMPRKYVLVVNFNISGNFISDIQAKGFHFLVSSGHANMIQQASFTCVTNTLIGVSQMPLRPLLCSSLKI